VDELVERVAIGRVVVRTPDATELQGLLARQGATVTSEGTGALTVGGASSEAIGDLARDHGIALHELTPQRASLEQAYMELTEDAVEFRDERSLA
jgi:ABC-2 type transport system ATP-binding protein